MPQRRSFFITVLVSEYFGDAEIAGVEIAGEGKVWKAKVSKMCF